MALLLGFVQPLASDTSVYLLQTRTLLETGNRYIASHDSKGPLMVWLSAPAVFVCGATACAAGLLRAAAGLIMGTVTYRLICQSGGRSRGFALHIAALTVILPYSAFIWGDSLRPEVYAIPLTGLILWFGMRNTVGTAFLAGAATGALLLLKPPLVIPALPILGGWLWMGRTKDKWWAGKIAGAMVFGASMTVLIAAICLAQHDSLPNWYRQTIEWPAEYRQAAQSEQTLPVPTSFWARLVNTYKASDDPAQPWLMPIKISVNLMRSGTWPLFLFAAWLAYRYGINRSRASLLTAGWLIGVIIELGLEYRRWLYPVGNLLPPLLLWTALSPMKRSSEGSRLLAAWFCSGILLTGLGLEAFRNLPGRLRGASLSPYEDLAKRMRSDYHPGDSLLVLDNNYSLHLLLPAPAPPPILPLHAGMVSHQERDSLRRQLEQSPPKWLAAKSPYYSGIRFGGANESFVQVQNDHRELTISGPYSIFYIGSNAWVRRLNTHAYRPVSPSGSKSDADAFQP